MTNSRRIAGLLGPALVAVSMSEAMNPRIWANTPATVVYLSGTLWRIAGLSIVRVHNCWRRDWAVLVTLLGWLLILGGLIRMFAPGFAQQQVQDTTVVFASQMVLLAIGIFLTFKSHGRKNSETAVC